MIRILLVEDDQDDVDLFKYALTTSCVRYELAVIMRGDEVMAYMQTTATRPDVVVMDLNLPMVHGREVLRQIRTTDCFSDIPVVVLTTSSAPEDREYCLSMGANEFITKPISIAAFAKTVKTVVELAFSR